MRNADVNAMLIIMKSFFRHIIIQVNDPDVFLDRNMNFARVAGENCKSAL